MDQEDDTTTGSSPSTSTGRGADQGVAKSETNGNCEPEPWCRFSDWVHCLCVVTFDLELGQALEVVYPGHAELTDKEKANICYLAFPDSNSGCMGDTTFHVRMRRFTTQPLSPCLTEYNKRCPTVTNVNSGYYYGFIHFRQVKDVSIRRGYFQKSVILISMLPLVQLFSLVVRTIAPEYFESGEAALEAACHDIDQWPSPVPGTTYNLPLMGSVIQCHLPSNAAGKQKSHKLTQEPSFPAPIMMPSVYEPKLYESLSHLISQLQLLWELVLLGEPLVVMAGSPQVCSSVVQSLVSLIWPLVYANDFRPFFTIHDSEFKEFTSGKGLPPPRVLLGVTNPFFTKTLQHWPHIIRLSETAVISANASPVSSQKLKKMGEVRTLDNLPGVYTQYKPFLVKDKAFVKRVNKGKEQGRPAEAQNALIRRHFLEMTQSFMIPLERYIASLMPLQRQLSPFKAAPSTRQFDFNEFLGTLDVSGPALTSGIKGDWNGLYRSFVQSPNFELWYQQRQLEVSHKLNLLHLDVLCQTDFAECDLGSFYEVEMVDLILKFKDKLDFVDANRDSVRPQLRNKLLDQLRVILRSLDDDLRAVLMSNTQLSLADVLGD